MGAPTSCTPEVTAIICAEIEAGMPQCVAAALAGVHRDSVHEWYTRGKAGDEKYAAFYEACALARAKRVKSLLAIVDAGADAYDAGPGHVKGDWKSATWQLEKLEPLIFGSRARVEVTGEGGGPLLPGAFVAFLPAPLALPDWQAAAQAHLAQQADAITASEAADDDKPGA